MSHSARSAVGSPLLFRGCSLLRWRVCSLRARDRTNTCCRARQTRRSSSRGARLKELPATEAATQAGDAPAAAAQAVGRKACTAEAADQELDGEYHDFFRQLWGPRWPPLFASLVAPTRHVALQNAFVLRPPTHDSLPGAAPLADRHPELAAVLDAVAGVSGSAGVVQALAWAPGSPPPAADCSTDGSGGSSAQPGGKQVAAAVSYPPPGADPATGLSTHYWLDAASLLPPLLLGVRPGHEVLDMCAAPGGKSLVLAQLLFAAEHAAEQAAAAAEEGKEAGGSSEAAGGSSGGGSSRGVWGAAGAGRGGVGGAGYSGRLVCNEIDGGRRARLVRVLKEYVPPAVREHVRVTPHDAAKWWGRQDGESFDRVLLDAPCSSDRHVAQQAAARGSAAIPRAAWSAQRCRRIAGDQAKLLAAGVKALRPGGLLVYSTCSIADQENDGVVERVLERAGGTLAIISHSLHPPVLTDGGSSTSGSSIAGESSEQPPAAAAQAALAVLVAMGAERTRHGWLLLPDATKPAAGPIYLAVMCKLASSDLVRVKVNKYARTQE